MNITVPPLPTVPFTNWRPGMQLAGTRIALDTETELAKPGSTPRLVLLTAYDGHTGHFVADRHAAVFIAAHPAAHFVFHNAAFDLAVLRQAGVNVDGLVEAGRVWDAGLLYRLLKLADTGNCHGRWSLDHVAAELLNLSLSKDVQSTDGQPVRTTYGRFLRANGTVDYPALLQPQHRSYLEYAAGDGIVTWHLAEKLNAWARRLFDSNLDIFDPTTYPHAGVQDHVAVGPAWQQHGILTHHIQLKASIALAAVEQRGMHIDSTRVARTVSELDASITAVQTALAKHGWRPGVGSQKRYNEILRGIEQTASATLPRTESGDYSRAADELVEYRTVAPFIDAYLRFQELNKLRGTFMTPLANGASTVRGHFNVIVNTGRTSCGGSSDPDAPGLNLQNLPRDGDVRACLVPSPGHYLLSIDYSAIELATLAQHCLHRFGGSRMADAIAKGADLHSLDAAMRIGIDVQRLSDWSKRALMPLLGPDAEKLRQKSKAKNFGLPGGLGARTFVEYARASYGVELAEEDARVEKERWLETWPEMRQHLQSDDLALLAACFPECWRKHPSARPGTTYDRVPWPIFVFKGIVCGQHATKTTGRAYSTDEIEWAWATATTVLGETPNLAAQERAIALAQIKERLPGLDLWRVLLPRQRFVATLTGRLRGYPAYCAAKNCVFQGLAADGAKLALYALHREGYRVVNFIHDEYLIELPLAVNHRTEAERIRRILVESMQAVVPDVPVACEYALMTRWIKGAQARYDVAGNLIPSDLAANHAMQGVADCPVTTPPPILAVTPADERVPGNHLPYLEREEAP